MIKGGITEHIIQDEKRAVILPKLGFPEIETSPHHHTTIFIPEKSRFEKKETTKNPHTFNLKLLFKKIYIYVYVSLPRASTHHSIPESIGVTILISILRNMLFIKSCC